MDLLFVQLNFIWVVHYCWFWLNTQGWLVLLHKWQLLNCASKHLSLGLQVKWSFIDVVVQEVADELVDVTFDLRLSRF